MDTVLRLTLLLLVVLAALGLGVAIAPAPTCEPSASELAFYEAAGRYYEAKARHEAQEYAYYRQFWEAEP